MDLLFSLVSIPFIAGQWSLLYWALNWLLETHVSIPFIAGQWSLLTKLSTQDSNSPSGFNPLHCGAVVASIGLSIGLQKPIESFNPLHCGAVVASGGSFGR